MQQIRSYCLPVIPVAVVASVQFPGSQSSYHILRKFLRKTTERWIGRESYFFDEATFHVSGKVNGHNVRVWGTQNAHEDVDVSDSSKVNYVIDSDSTKRLVVYQSERSAILTSFVRYKYLAINTRLHSSDNS